HTSTKRLTYQADQTYSFTAMLKGQRFVLLFSLVLRHSLRSTLFPYSTLFRSRDQRMTALFPLRPPVQLEKPNNPKKTNQETENNEINDSREAKAASLQAQPKQKTKNETKLNT